MLSTPQAPLSLPSWLTPHRPSLPPFRPGESMNCWIGGYVPKGPTFDSLLVGIWERKGLRFVGFLGSAWRVADKGGLFTKVREIPLETCPFFNLAGREDRGEPLALPDSTVAQCRWLFPSQRISVAYEDLTVKAA